MIEKLNQLIQTRNEMSKKLMDTCAVLTAIETLFHESVIVFDRDAPDCAQHLQTLILIALEKAREADSLSDDLDPILGGLRYDAKEEWLSADEADFLANYRQCSKTDKKTVMQLALRARNDSSGQHAE